MSRLVFVSHSSELGGAERSMLELAAALHHVGHEVKIFYPEPGPLVGSATGLGIGVRQVRFRRWATYAPGPLRRMGRLLQIPVGAVQVALALRAEPGSVVVSNSGTVGAGALGAAALRRHHVWWVHEFINADNSAYPVLGEAFTIRLIQRLSATVITNSASTAAWLERHGCRAVVIPNPIPYDTPPDGPRPISHSGPLQLAMLGALVPHKGHEDAIQAVGIAVDEERDVELTIAGDGSIARHGDLRALAEASGVADRVHFIGPVDRAVDLVDRADVGLVCSWREAFGRVTIEFHKGGRPVIGTATGQTEALIIPGVTGFLYEPGDVGALAAHIIRCHDDRSLVRRLGHAAASSTAGTFTLEQTVSQFVAAVGLANPAVEGR